MICTSNSSVGFVRRRVGARWSLRRATSIAALAIAAPWATVAPCATRTVEAAIPVSIPARPLDAALVEFSQQMGVPVFAEWRLVQGKISRAVSGNLTPGAALERMLHGTNLTRMNLDGIYVVVDQTARVHRAAAQTVEPMPVSTPAEAKAESAGPGLEEIIVTAQRRGENLQRVPISVSAVSATQLAAIGIAGNSDIKLAVPGVDVPIASGFATPFIRGVGNKIIGPGTEVAVSTYVDNVYIGNLVASVLSFNNLARVEVLKGPQGTLFGRNTTGGIISVITRDPTDQFQLNARAGYGNYQTVNGDLYVGGPIANGVKADFAAYGKHQGKGYGTNLFSGKEIGRTYYDFGVRSKWLVGDGPLTVKLTGDYSQLKTTGFVQRVALDYTAPPAYAVGANYGGSPWDSDANVLNLVKTKGGGVSAKADYEISPAVTLVSISAWRKSRYFSHLDGDVTRTDAREIIGTQIDEQFSQELQLLSGPALPFTWVAGAFLYDAKGRSAPGILVINGPARAAPGPFNGLGQFVTFVEQKVFSIAPYAQTTVEIVDATKLTLGLRYTYEKRTQDGEGRAFLPTGVQVGPTLTTPPANRRLVANELTWRIALDHQFSPDVMGYVSYNRGFKSGGANTTSVTAPMYGPEKLDAYEVGLKSSLFGRRVRLNGAAFYYDYKDVQVASVESGIVSIYNAATARIYGLELDLDAQVTSQLRLNAGYSYLNARFTEFPSALTNTFNPAGGVTQSFQSAKGNKLPNAPESVITVGASYLVPLGANSLTFNGNVYHSSSYFTEPDNFRGQDAYELYNASVEFNLGDRWTFTLWGKNLSNEAVDLFPSVNGLGGGIGIPRSAFAPPRTYGVTVGVKI